MEPLCMQEYWSSYDDQIIPKHILQQVKIYRWINIVCSPQFFLLIHVLFMATLTVHCYPIWKHVAT